MAASERFIDHGDKGGELLKLLPYATRADAIASQRQQLKRSIFVERFDQERRPMVIRSANDVFNDHHFLLFKWPLTGAVGYVLSIGTAPKEWEGI